MNATTSTTLAIATFLSLAVGAIEIADRFSLVEVPESTADGVIAALKNSTIKGRRTVVRRERF